MTRTQSTWLCVLGGVGWLCNTGVHYKAQCRETKFKRESGTDHKSLKIYKYIIISTLAWGQWGPVEGF